jgi:diphthamide synthase subunit DPH2
LQRRKKQLKYNLIKGDFMRIVICGSVNFAEKIREVERALKERGHDVVLPYSIMGYGLDTDEEAQKLKTSDGFNTKVKPGLTKRHFNEIKNGDAILVVNVEKKGIPNYIGGATFSEIMLAFHYGKKIFFLNPIPDDERLAMFRDELECVQPVVLKGDLNLVK